MYYQPFEPKKKRGRFWLWLTLLVVAGALGSAGVFYGPGLYYSIAGDALVRIEKRTGELEARLLAWDGGNAAVGDLLGELAEIRRIIEIQERNTPAEAQIHYYRGLLNFYELVIRIPLGGPSLMQLTGRGFLPLQKSIESVPETAIPRLSQRISRNMRKALALDPGLRQKNAAYLMMVYGDLFFTERTDDYLLTTLSERVAGQELAPVLQRYRDWIGLALFALSGRKQEMRQLMTAIEAARTTDGSGSGDSANEEPTVTGSGPRMVLDPNIRDLVLCHGYYYAQDYLPALQLARQVKHNPTTPDLLKVEAVRMEGEIFLVQRGAPAACFFFQEAAQIGDDHFVTDRINTICSNH